MKEFMDDSWKKISYGFLKESVREIMTKPMEAFLEECSKIFFVSTLEEILKEILEKCLKHGRCSKEIHGAILGGIEGRFVNHSLSYPWIVFNMKPSVKFWRNRSKNF